MARNRAERRSNTKRVINKRLKELKQLDPSYHEHIKDKPNSVSKKHPLDCGKPGCNLCHPKDTTPRNKKVDEEE